MENTPPEVREIARGRSPRPILVAEGCKLPRGGVFSNSSQLEAVYCHSFFQSGSVLDITLQTAGVYWRYIDLIHSCSMKKNDHGLNILDLVSSCPP